MEAASALACTSLRDFIRRKALDAPEADILERRIVTIPAKDWGAFEAGRTVHRKRLQGSRISRASRQHGGNATRPLSEIDDRARFGCGRESLNHWFQRHGWANHAAGISRRNVSCDAATFLRLGLAKRDAYSHQAQRHSRHIVMRMHDIISSPNLIILKLQEFSKARLRARA